MPYAFIQDLPITVEQYAVIRSEIGNDAPKGLVAHVVMRHDAGLRYVDVWDSQADWERFHDDKVQPAVRKMMATDGIVAPPQPAPHQTIDVIDTLVGPAN
jgi:hypothetical protein